MKITNTYSTNYQKWTSDTRSFLMPLIKYEQVIRERQQCWVPKLGDEIEVNILAKMTGTKTAVKNLIASNSSIDNRIYYRTTGGLYWKVFTDFAPAFRIMTKTVIQLAKHVWRYREKDNTFYYCSS